MDAKKKIQIEYYFKCEKTLSEVLRSFKQILNMRGQYYKTQFRLIPLEYIEGGNLCNSDYVLLDHVMLLPNLHTGSTSYCTSTIHLSDIIQYTEESYKWLINEIQKLKFSEAYGNYPNNNKKIYKVKNKDYIKKKTWAGSKSEFAKFVNETYNSKPSKYRSLQDASHKLFEQYEFEDKRWTREKCYDLVRKT